MNSMKTDVVYTRPVSALSSFRYKSLQRSRRRPPLQDLVFSTDGPARIGVVSDVHHNTLTFLDALQMFGDMGVNVLFLLGDYSFVPSRLNGADPGDLRFRQFSKVMQMARDYQLAHSAEVVCIMGNHEIESWYFAEGSCSQQLMADMIPTLRSWGFRLPQMPFAGFELAQAVQVTIDANFLEVPNDLDTRRTFLLSHAISSPLVNALYQGFPIDAMSARKMRDEIDATLGSLWSSYIDDASVVARDLWADFCSGSAQVAADIRDNIASGLSFDRLAAAFVAKGAEGSDWVDWLLKLDDSVLTSVISHFVQFDDPYSAFFEKDANIPKSDSDAEMFSLMKTLTAVGIGCDYTLSGHFHADLGAYGISERLGALGVAGAGFQIGKTITDQLCCYVIEVDSRQDTIYRLSTPAHLDGRQDEHVDLSGALSAA
jgi:calcineurin-like phosphoesterase family protein